MAQLITLTKAIRSTATGKMLPRDGEIINAMENLGRQIYLVAFPNGERQWLFNGEFDMATEVSTG